MDRNTFLLSRPAADFLTQHGCPTTEMTLQKWFRQGRVAGYKPSRKRLLFRPADLIAFVESARVPVREK